MKSIMISIKPKYCELIANGKKTVEVRKTKPKIDVPFKCYIYCTQEKYKVDALRILPNGRVEGWQIERANILGKYCNGKVIGEFVCDEIYHIKNYGTRLSIDNNERLTNEVARASCLDFEDMKNYLVSKNGYAWHITDLVIYDKPKELGELRTPCKMRERLCGICDYAVHGMDGDLIDCDTSLERPFQSWGYIEDLGV